MNIGTAVSTNIAARCLTFTTLLDTCRFSFCVLVSVGPFKEVRIMPSTLAVAVRLLPLSKILFPGVDVDLPEWADSIIKGYRGQIWVRPVGDKYRVVIGRAYVSALHLINKHWLEEFREVFPEDFPVYIQKVG